VTDELKPLLWIGSAKRDLNSMPNEVQQVFGFALFQAQIGLIHSAAKPLKGFGSAGVVEIVEDWREFLSCGLHGSFRARDLRLALL
jgi:phage-related protein